MSENASKSNGKNGHELTAGELAKLCARGQHKGTVTDRAGRKSCALCGVEVCASCESTCLSHTRWGSRCNACGHVTITNPPRPGPGAPVHQAPPSASANVMRAVEYPSTAFLASDGRVG